MLEGLQNIVMPELLSGHSALDFTNTIESRHSKTQFDFLNSYNDLIAWSQCVGYLSDENAERLYNIAITQPHAADDVFRITIELREAVYTIFTTFIETGNGKSVNLEPFTKIFYTIPYQLPEVLSDRIVLGWPNDYWNLERIYWPIGKAAADLLTSENLRKVCKCPSCGWLFVDTSRNHQRRWCSMRYCGSHVKARQQYMRKLSEKRSS
ncbi:MAG: CGNR zinc finger domain-containing protein [Burkholderiales bacterium]|nr:CGNR zinc finger domain-containing protein [Anaerolineae bacterium]